MAENGSPSINSDQNPTDTGAGAGDVADSWEDLEDDEALERDIEQRQAEYKSHLEKQSRLGLGKVQVCDTSVEGQYKPQLKILKRQVNDTDEQTNKQAEIKSLEERQLEYMKARERILGSARPAQYAYSDEEEEEEAKTKPPVPPVSIQKR